MTSPAFQAGRLMAALTLSLSVCAVTPALAERREGPVEPTIDAMGVISQKVVHRSGPHASATKAVAPPAGSTGAASQPISYHNGPVMTAVSKVVVIWYGNWNQSDGTDTPAGQQIIRDALYGLAQAAPAGYTNYAGVTTGASSSLGRYTQANPAGAVSQISSTNLVELTQSASAAYGGATLTDASVQALVKAAAVSVGADPNAIYLVLSSGDIGERSGFLTNYCGWHTYSTISGQPLKYGFIGNPRKNISACNANTSGVSPNGNPAVDAMVSVIAHELEETATDPLLNAWWNASGSESGDMCAWTFGASPTRVASTNAATNGSYYNVTLPTKTGSRSYLIQRALAASNSKCYVNATGAVQ